MQTMSKYQSQAARDAEQGSYGGPAYWEYLDRHALELRDKYLAAGDMEAAEGTMTRSLGEALSGNAGN